MAQSPRRSRKAAVPTPSRGGGRRPYFDPLIDGAVCGPTPQGGFSWPVGPIHLLWTSAPTWCNTSFVGRGILDAPTRHPIRGRQGCRPLRWWWSAVPHSGTNRPVENGCCLPAAAHTGAALWTMGCFAGCGQREFRALRGATRGAAFGNRDLGNAPPVGKRCRRGILCQSKAQLCRHTGCMARSWAAAMAQKARRRPQTHRW